MKKLLFVLVFLIVGCGTTEEVTYINSNNTMKLRIRHANQGNSVNVEITSAEEAKAYKDRMQKIIRAIEDFEKELSIREK